MNPSARVHEGVVDVVLEVGEGEGGGAKVRGRGAVTGAEKHWCVEPKGRGHARDIGTCLGEDTFQVVPDERELSVRDRVPAVGECSRAWYSGGMLTRFCRVGASRHGLLRGVVIVGTDSHRVADKLVKGFVSHGVRAVRAGSGRRDATPIALDTGMRWVHDAEARAAFFHDLTGATAHLAARVGADGCTLVPAAVSRAPGSPAAFSGDDHVIEVVEEAERLALYHALVDAEAALLAIASRSTVTTRGVVGRGSARLAASGAHIAPCAIPSVHARQLPLVRACLRQQGVRRLEHMDVDPIGLPDARDADVPVPNVCVRYCDAQIFPSTVRAHMLVLQAISMRARREARKGGRPQAPLLDDEVAARRAAAVAFGADARFGTGADAISAVARIATILEELSPELCALGAETAEVAPLAVGASLRVQGVRALRNEDDWARAVFRHAGTEGLAVILASFAGRPPDELGGIPEMNRRRWPAAELCERAWAARLGSPRRARVMNAWQRVVETLHAGRGMVAQLRLALLDLREDEGCYDLDGVPQHCGLAADEWEGMLLRMREGIPVTKGRPPDGEEPLWPFPGDALRVLLEGPIEVVREDERRISALRGATVFRVRGEPEDPRSLELLVVRAADVHP